MTRVVQRCHVVMSQRETSSGMYLKLVDIQVCDLP
jgi:hypothetical protein